MKPDTDRLRGLFPGLDDEAFAEQRRAILDEMRRRNPKLFDLKPLMRSALTFVADANGITLDEQIEETAIGAYLLHRATTEDEKADIAQALKSLSDERRDQRIKE